MKIGIVTIYRGTNYGAFLQANALRRYLADRGHDVFFVKHRARKPFLALGKRSIEACMHMKPGNIPFYIQQYRELNRYGKVLKEIEMSKLSKLDMAFYGSDEIWNIKRKRIHKFPVFFGLKMPERVHKYSYAPSVNNSDEGEFSPYPDCVEGIKSMKRISVRDEISKWVIDTVTGQDSLVVVDPTLLQKKSYYDKVASKEKFEGKNVLIYSYGKEEKQQKNIINKLSKCGRDGGFKFISILEPLGWADRNLPVNPKQMLALYRDSEFVVTDTFHGIIFSLIYRKPFAILPVSSNKVDALAKMFGLQDRILTEANVEELFNTAPDFDAIEKKIAPYREASEEYINDILRDEHRII
ncbi:MAG: polysaccharide pyruvyl transferase family protein [Eubacterium sp.]|nr:polysaccharide pyruvyl transferase family protein [Eubacterium sp.]